VDDRMLALARRQLGTATARETVSRALRLAAGAGTDDRARRLRWLQDNAERFLDFEVLEHRERSGL